MATVQDNNNFIDSAVSNATSNVIDNSALSVFVFTPLPGSSTYTSNAFPADADDVAAPITYQWKTSTDGGATWTDIAGATSLSYTTTEADEGNQIRLHASFTDDTNQLVQA